MRDMIRAAIRTVLLLGLATSAAAQGGHPASRNADRGKKEGAMSLTIEQAAEKSVATLSASEKASSVVYLDSEKIKAGESVQAGREPLVAPWDALMSFVDLQPTANWGHRCRYLFINAHTGEIKSFDASFPPFLEVWSIEDAARSLEGRACARLGSRCPLTSGWLGCFLGAGSCGAGRDERAFSPPALPRSTSHGPRRYHLSSRQLSTTAQFPSYVPNL